MARPVNKNEVKGILKSQNHQNGWGHHVVQNDGEALPPILKHWWEPTSRQRVQAVRFEYTKHSKRSVL